MNRQYAPSASRPRRTNRSSFFAKSHKRRRRFFRPLVEQLEPRLLLATLGPDDVVISGFNGKIGALNEVTEELTIFAELPKVRALDFTSDNTRLYVVTDKSLVAFDRDGNVVIDKNIEEHVASSGDLTIANDTIYIATDSSPPIQRFDLDGNYLGPFGPLFTPFIRDIEALPDGTFIAGTHHLDADGNVIGTIGNRDVGALAFDEANNDLLVFPEFSADIYRLDYPSFEVLVQGVGLVQFDAFSDAEIGSILAISNTTFAVEIFDENLVPTKDIKLNLLGGGLFLATQNPILAPNITATKTATLLPEHDSDSDGKADPGDVIQYTVTVSNSGTLAAEAVAFTDNVGFGTTLVAGSITVNDVPATSNTAGIVDVALGDLAADANATKVIRFNVTIDDDAFSTILNQGTVTGQNFGGDVLTDDPTKTGVADPTEVFLDVIVVSPDGNNPNGIGDGEPDHVLVRRSGDNIEIVVNGNVSQTVPVADINTGRIVVLGSTDNDTLTIDFTGGNPVPTGGIRFLNDDNSGTNDIRLVGVTGDLLSQTLTGDRSGKINIDGSIIQFTEVSMIEDDFEGDRKFNLGDGDNTGALTCPELTNGEEGEGPRTCTLDADGFLVVFPRDPLLNHEIFINLADGNDVFSRAGAPYPTIVHGGLGHDSIRGGPGPDVLVGGPGMDKLAGGDGPDILIGGGTTLGDDPIARILRLLDDLAEGRITFQEFTDQVSAGDNGAGPLNGTTAPNDNEMDTLQGGEGTDWFFDFPGDKFDLNKIFSIPKNIESTINPREPSSEDRSEGGTPPPDLVKVDSPPGDVTVTVTPDGRLLVRLRDEFVGTEGFSATAKNSDGSELPFDFTINVGEAATGFDYGDAPQSYGTLEADNGPRHSGFGPMLGTRRDVEDDGQPDEFAGTADGDLAGGDDEFGDDEDGLIDHVLVAGDVASYILFKVTIPTAFPFADDNPTAMLDAWIDYNNDGMFDPRPVADGGERITPADGKMVTPGTKVITFDVPEDIESGPRFLRMRLSSLGGLNPKDEDAAGNPITTFADGEVEDHVVEIVTLDYGDAPDSYRTTELADGPSHRAVGPKLGSLRDTERNAKTPLDTTGDDKQNAPDEDGLGDVNLIQNSAKSSLTVNVSMPAGQQNARLDAFLDLNNDGQFDSRLLIDGGERITPADGLSVGNGPKEFPVPVPQGVFGDRVLRLRLSSEGGLNPANINAAGERIGFASDGEVEDHLVTILENEPPEVPVFDFGDAPASFGTNAAGNPPRHLAVGPILGTLRDAELLPETPLDGTGDDVNGAGPEVVDDEDGLVAVDLLSQNPSITVRVTLPEGQSSARLDAWVDVNDNGVFDDFERVTAAQGTVVTAGDNVIALPPLANFVGPNRERFIRLRLSSTGGLAATGLDGTSGTAADGEVEDHVIALPDFDYGDAPDSYKTLRSSDGPRHVPIGPILGTKRDAEFDAANPLDGTGDGDDEDGVSLFRVGGRAFARVIVSGAETARLNAWIDHNDNGAFEDFEQITTESGNLLLAGENIIELPDIRVADLMARFRISSAGGLHPVGSAADGEVEDYRFTFNAASIPELTTNLFDFGDAPDSYTTRLPDGARHLAGGPTLGVSRDLEPNASSPLNGDGDQVDEDGFGRLQIIEVDRATKMFRVRLIVNAADADTGKDTAKLDAWLDLNGDGRFDPRPISFLLQGHPEGERITPENGAQVGTRQRAQKTLSSRGVETKVVPQTTAYEFLLPIAARLNTFLRLRISSAGGLGPSGIAADGEVEDHFVAAIINESDKLFVPGFLPLATDFGDAPESFKTLYADDGPRHLFLGSRFSVGDDFSRDAEFDAGGISFTFFTGGGSKLSRSGKDLPELTSLIFGPALGAIEGDPGGRLRALADDESRVVDDEKDLYQFSARVGEGSSAKVVAKNLLSRPLFIHAWVDFNKDGMFDPLPIADGGERITSPPIAVPAMSGTKEYTIRFTTPSNAAPGEVVVRYRLSSESDLGPTGATLDGEVEDHVFEILPPEKVSLNVDVGGSVFMRTGGESNEILEATDEFGTPIGIQELANTAGVIITGGDTVTFETGLTRLPDGYQVRRDTSTGGLIILEAGPGDPGNRGQGSLLVTSPGSGIVLGPDSSPNISFEGVHEVHDRGGTLGIIEIGGDFPRNPTISVTQDPDSTATRVEITPETGGVPSVYKFVGTVTLNGGIGDDNMEIDILGGPPGDYQFHGGLGDDNLDARKSVAPVELHGGFGDDILFGGTRNFPGRGDDRVEMGPLGGIVFSTPGSDDHYVGSDAEDTIDFSLVFEDIAFDLDRQTPQSVDEKENTIQLTGQWEHFVGGFGDDVLAATWLPNAQRSLIGGDGLDWLFLYAKGGSPTFVDKTIHLPGFEDITVEGFEIIEFINTADELSQRPAITNIQLTRPTNVHVRVDNGQLLAGTDGKQLLNEPTDGIQQFGINGSPRNDRITLDGSTLGAGPPTININGKGGIDRYDWTGSDLNQNLGVVPQGQGEGESDLVDINLERIEIIDITGTGDNSLTLGVEDVLRISDTGTLEVIANPGDSVNIGPGWQLVETVVEDGKFVRIFQQGTATLRSIGPQDWSNPSNPLDVNGSGTVEPVDVLIIFNELNNRRYSEAGGRLKAAADQATFPNFLLDTVPDGFVVPLDALVIINALNRATASTEGEDRQPFLAAAMDAGNPFASAVQLQAIEAIRDTDEAPFMTSKLVDDSSRIFADASATPNRSAPRSVTYQELTEAIDEILAEFDALLL